MSTEGKTAWKTLPLIQVATLQRGFDLPVQNRIAGDVPVFAANGPVGTHNEQKMPGPGVVTGRSGTIGKVHYVSTGYWPLNTSLFVKDFHGNHPKFIYYLLSNMHLERYLEGTGVPTLNRNNVHDVEISLPPLSEQKRIAEILDKSDTIQRKRREAYDIMDALTQASFLDIVGPGARGYQSWPLTTIEQLAAPEAGSMRTGPFGSDLLHSEFVAKGVPVLGIDNAVQNKFAWAERRCITNEKYEELKRFTVKPNDVIITIMGTTGRSAVVPEDIPRAITSKHLACITLNRSVAEPEFVSHSIHRHPAVLNQIGSSHRGAVMPGLNLTLIKSLKLHVPPMKEQRYFTKCIKQLRTFEAKHQNASCETNNLFNSLVQRAFRGEL